MFRRTGFLALTLGAILGLMTLAPVRAAGQVGFGVAVNTGYPAYPDPYSYPCPYAPYPYARYPYPYAYNPYVSY